MRQIKKPEQMTRPIVWNPLSPERKTGLQKDMWWAKDSHVQLKDWEKPNAEKMFVLRDKILKFGGEEFCMPITPDKDYERILERCEFFYGSSYRRTGAPSQCHRNSCYLWQANKRDDVRIATGYALSEDGIWREHSWVVQRLATKWRVWETTVRRVAYFGYIMTPEECENFCEDNF